MKRLYTLSNANFQLKLLCAKPIRILFLLVIFLYSIPGSSQTYTVNGSAVDFGNGKVRLTSFTPQPPLVAGDWQTGSAWSTTKHNLNNPFDMTFDMFFGCESGLNGGDGITFTFQNKGPNAIGEGGGYLGVGGVLPAARVTPSISIEFDTYDGTPWGGSNELQDNVTDHIAIDRNGDVNNTTSTFTGTSGPVTYQAIRGNRDLENCSANANNYYTIRVTWTPATRQLRLYEEGVLTMTYTEDIINTIFGGNPSVYWGFTSATGSASNEQWIAPAGSIIPWQCSFATSCCNTYTVTPSGPTDFCGTNLAYTVPNTFTSYSWSTGSTTSSAAITAGGTYTVNVVQSQGGQLCPATATFTVGTNCPAPVELLSFTGNKKDHSVHLNWSTAMEQNNDYFEIFHSTDGINFSSLTKVDGIGNSKELNQYSFIHKQPSHGLNYYKLIQFDLDGKENYGGMTSIEYEKIHVNVYPNPSFSNFNVNISGNETATLSLSDITGKEILSLNGTNFMLGNDLPKGSYILKVTTNREVKTVQLIKEN